MRIGIDIREIENEVSTGIGRPLANFLTCTAHPEDDDHYVLFSSRPAPFPLNRKMENVVVKERFTFYWDQVQLPRAIRSQHLDLFYSPYYKIPLLAHCRKVSSILDLMYLAFPEYRKKLSLPARLYYHTFGKKCAEQADRILTCSDHSKRDIVRLYGVDAEKIVVIPLSVGDMYRPEPYARRIEALKTRFGIVGRYILYLGNFKPHKNVRNIILSFDKVAREIADLKLVLAGPKTHTYPELRRLVEEMSLGDKVIFTGTILEKDRPHLLYSGAEVFVMPSLYEGFGLPPAEAMACGVPVVVSNSTSLPEVVGDAGVLVDPTDVDQIAQAVLRVLTDSGLRDGLRKRGLERAAIFSPERIAGQTREVFRRLMESHSQND